MIGITLGNETSMFCDGMRKHCFYFYQQMIYLGMDPAFLCTDKVYDWLEREHSDVQAIRYTNVPQIQSISKIIEWEVFIPISLRCVCKKFGIPVIRMNCGNMYETTQTKFMQNKENSLIADHEYVTEFWGLPHYKREKYMKQHLYHKPVHTLPYIFQFDSFQQHNPDFTPNTPISILILEPNLSKVKSCFVPLLSSIHVLKQHPTLIRDIQVYCSKHIQTSIHSLLQSFNSTIDKQRFKLFPRIKFPSILSQQKENVCVILSHQSQNNLNNLYFDAIQYGVPLIHNSRAIKDVGYFYRDNDIYEIETILNMIYRGGDDIPSKLRKDYETANKRWSPYSKSAMDQMKQLLGQSTTTIPRILHQTYSNIHNLLPNMRNHQEQMQMLFKQNGWDYKFYDDATRESVIQQGFSPDVLQAYQTIHPEYGPARADFFRYCIMYLKGGVYVDIKSEFKPDVIQLPFFQKNATKSIFLSRWSKRFSGVGENSAEFAPDGEICNWILISKPNHPFWLDLVRWITKQILHPERVYVGKSGVLRLTGPIAFTQFYKTHKHKYENDIAIYPRSEYTRFATFDFLNSIHPRIGAVRLASDHSKLYKNHYSTLHTPVLISQRHI